MKTVFADKILSILDYNAFKYYRNHRKIKNSAVTNRAVYSKILRTLFEKAVDDLLENESGVVLHGIGYISTVRFPYQQLVKKKFIKINNKVTNAQLYNLHTNRYMYLLTVFTDVHKSNVLKNWSMDYTFKEQLRHKLSVKLKSGKKYKLEYNLVKEVLKNKI